MVRCVRVPKRDGESVRSRLVSEDLLDLRSRIRADGDSLLIPILCDSFEDYEVVDEELEIQEQKVGQTLRVIVDREEEDYYIGRTQWDSPEVDPEVLITKNTPLTIGDLAQVRITQAMPFELIADVC